MRGFSFAGDDMQTQSRGNGQQQPRGVQGRPDIRAQEKFGEARVLEILQERKHEILALFANDPRPEAMFDRACGLAAGAYKKAQDDENESASRQNKSPRRIDEVSAVACCIWSMQRKLDPGIDVYFVPYGGKLTPIMSPDGVIKLLFRTGMVKAVNAKYVFNGSPNPKEGEELFDYMLGSTQWVKHKKNNVRPRSAKDNRGQVAENVHEWQLLSHAYAIIDLKDGGQIIEVLDKADIAYFRSLSPTGDSAFGGWGKFPAAFGRKAALKQAAKFAPKDSEVSIILTADDTDRGIEIPDEVWKAVGSKMLNEMTGETGVPAGNVESSPETQHSKRQIVYTPGDAKKLCIPGKAPQPTIFQADNQVLLDWEAKMRGDFDAKKWNEQWFERNATQLATIRFELRDRGVAVPPHSAFDAEQQVQQATQQPPQREVEQVQEQDPGYGGQERIRQPGED
jgi:recombinational DNA repair protein RecT